MRKAADECVIRWSQSRSRSGAGLLGEDMSDSRALADALWHARSSQPWLCGTACIISESVAGTRCSCPSVLR